MFVKILGSLIVIICSTLIGFLFSWSLEGRLKDLRTFRICLQILEREIAFLSSSLPDALICASKVNGNVSKIFKECAQLLKKQKGYCVSEAWNNSIDNNFKNTYFNSNDKDILNNLGKCLGLYDIQNQSNSINNILTQLEIQEEDVKKQIERNSKMYRNLGFLAGLAIIIILI